MKVFLEGNDIFSYCTGCGCIILNNGECVWHIGDEKYMTKFPKGQDELVGLERDKYYVVLPAEKSVVIREATKKEIEEYQKKNDEGITTA